MMRATTLVRACGFVPWDDDEGVPEFVVPGDPHPIADLVPIADRRAEVKVRVLPDGTPQLLAPTAYGARVVRLSAVRTHVDVRTDGQVMDAVLVGEGHVVALVRTARDGFFVQRVRPDGRQIRRQPIVGPTYRSRLLADARGRVFLTTEERLLRIDERRPDDQAAYAGPHEHWAVMCADGRVGFPSYDPDRDLRDWKLLDPDTGDVETAISGTDEMWGLLHAPLGVDAAGRVYSSGVYTFGRLTPTGGIDWEVELGGVAVSPRHGVAALLVDEEDEDMGETEERGATLLREDGALHLLEAPGWLVGYRDDGGHVLHQSFQGPVRDSHGELVFLGPQGNVTRREPAGGDVNLAWDTHGDPTGSSVTPDGSVLLPVTTRHGVYVVSFTPGQAATAADAP